MAVCEHIDEDTKTNSNANDTAAWLSVCATHFDIWIRHHHQWYKRGNVMLYIRNYDIIELGTEGFNRQSFVRTIHSIVMKWGEILSMI